MLKRGSYLNDTILLVAGVSLAWMAAVNPLQQSWLLLKLLLLPLYVWLGLYALRKGRGYGQRVLYFLAACGVYLFMLSVAHWHHPLGALSAYLA